MDFLASRETSERTPKAILSQTMLISISLGIYSYPNQKTTKTNKIPNLHLAGAKAEAWEARRERTAAAETFIVYYLFKIYQILL